MKSPDLLWGPRRLKVVFPVILVNSHNGPKSRVNLCRSCGDAFANFGAIA